MSTFTEDHMKTVLYFVLVAFAFFILDSVIELIVSTYQDSVFEWFTRDRWRSAIISALLVVFFRLFIRRRSSA